MNEQVFDVIIVGAGYAGLAASYHLKKYGIDHLVFERGRIGESWRTQRWDSFRTNSTNKLNVLPGQDWTDDSTADAFATTSELVSSFEQYSASHHLPVQQNSNVISVEKQGNFFHVVVSSDDTVTNYRSRQVLIASGAANKIKIPEISKNISPDVTQLHTSQYRNPAQLPKGAVLVVGSAQSGCQIAEDLLGTGRQVYLSTSRVGRFPRWYRGKDIFYWLADTKFYEIKADEVDDLKVLEARPPQISGTGSGKDSLSLQSLARQGATILGRLHDANRYNVFFELNAPRHVKYADEYSKEIKELIDGFIISNNLSAPPPHYDEADIPDVEMRCAATITFLNLRQTDINSIIWSTGFDADFSYIKLPIFASNGKLIHNNGTAHVPGLYLLGYPWLRTRKSSILFGIIDDAEYIVAKMLADLKESHQPSPLGK
jgi:putative flavoprotein involved in K+ transport